LSDLSFIKGLQITDSFFPVGSFAYSDGLETAASCGLVTDALTLQEWMGHFLENVFVPCEGLALVKSMIALQSGNLDTLVEIDQELAAIRPSRAARLSSTSVGKRLLSLYGAIHGDAQFSDVAGRLPRGNASVAYAIVFFHCGMPLREAAMAYGYNRLAAIVSAGLRLIALGQQQGQTILSKRLEQLPEVADRIVAMVEEPLRSFNLILDIQQMNHQYVYSRLFRS
jgi:urease accessory protein